jgi:PKD repeat protein
MKKMMGVGFLSILIQELKKNLLILTLIALGAGFSVQESYACTPNANFSVDNTTPVVGQQVTFTDASDDGGGQAINNWSWNFGSDASPSTATGSGPHYVTYSSVGLKTVSLTVTNGGVLGGSDTETKTDYINVGSLPTPGSIGTSQGICLGAGTPLITSLVDGTGSGTLSYEWQTNASGSYVTIPGEVSSTYQPPSLTTSTSYRRRTVAVYGTTTSYSSYTAVVTITVNPLPSATVNGQSDPLCYGNADGSISVLASGGSGSGYTFSNNNGSSYGGIGNPYTLSGLSANVAYKIRVKDSLGCESPAIP